jgi:hypothetical protein
MRIEEGSNGELGRFPARFSLEEEDGDVALAGGSHTSARGEGNKRYHFGMFTGPRLVSVLGRDSSPRPFLFLFFFSSFLLFFFCFLISFIDFAF